MQATAEQIAEFTAEEIEQLSLEELKSLSEETLSSLTLDNVIRIAKQLRAETSLASKRHDDLKTRTKDIDKLIIERMQEQGLTSTGNEVATVTLSEKTYPKITDWDAFYEYIHENKAFYLLQRRPGAKACEELIKLEGDKEFMEIASDPTLSLRNK